MFWGLYVLGLPEDIDSRQIKICAWNSDS